MEVEHERDVEVPNSDKDVRNVKESVSENIDHTNEEENVDIDTTGESRVS